MTPAMSGCGGATAEARTRWSSCRSAALCFIALALTAAAGLAGCSSSPTASRLPASSSSTIDPTATVRNAVLSAWTAAETALYQAAADPNGRNFPALDATMSGQQLELVKSNLATQESEGFIGQGPWNLGSPRVVSLGPSENDPRTATVVSCIHDTQILVNEQTGEPASGANGTREWVGETSTMTVSQGGWKLSQQSAVANTNRDIACAGIG